MDDLSWLLPLGSTALGGLLAIAGGTIGALIQGRREHRQWWRQQRADAYVDLLVATDNYLVVASHSTDEAAIAAAVDSSRDAAARLQLAGPKDVYLSAEAFQIATVVSIREQKPEVDEVRIVKRQEFIAASRRALAAPRR